MGTEEGAMELLGFEMEVARRGYHAKDHEGVPHEGIRRASVDEVRELLEVQSPREAGSQGGPRWGKRTGMGHVEPGRGRSLVGRSILQGAVQLPDVTRLGGAASMRWFMKARRVSCSCRPEGSPPERPVAAGSSVPRSPIMPELLGSRADPREWK